MTRDEYFSPSQFLLNFPRVFYTALWDTLIAIGYPLSAKISKNIANLQYREREYLSKSNIFKTEPIFPLKSLTVVQ